MRLAVGQRGAYADDEHGPELAADGVFALFCAHSGVHIEQVFTVDEVYFFGQERLNDAGVALAHNEFGAPYGGIYAAHCGFEAVERALCGGDYRLPVPLVNIQRVQVVKLFVGPYGVHVGVYAVVRLYGVVGKGEPFPFRQRVYNLRLGVAEVFDGERHGAFHTVQVVVYAESLEHEQRCRDAAQPQLGRQVGLEELFYQLYPLFGLPHVQQRLVAFRAYQSAHDGCC